ncbi:hypothetical protein SAMN06297251_105202 [Fulvimarina manganoxydans]|uniref:Uncharacterized protein n=1 Tax=Fulvimarina manganoxydans TaxID=937218 RepID=A0A1W2AZH9_9HYPH|nr:hypothetical protein SAMN06297251_105202 [Fulvimarina manganoxydans]
MRATLKDRQATARWGWSSTAFRAIRPASQRPDRLNVFVECCALSR